MGNHRPGSDDGLFHFQLDMPDKKPQPKAPSGSSAGRAQGSVQSQSGYARGSQSVNRTSQNRPASSGTYTGTSAGRTRSAGTRSAAASGTRTAGTRSAATSGSRAAGPRSAAASGARTAGTHTTRSAASGARTTGTRSTAASGARTAGTYTTRSAGARPGGTRTSGGRTGTGTRTARDGMRNSQQRPGPVRRRRSALPKRPDIRDISKQQGAAGKASFLLAFALFYIGAAYQWFRRELTPDKILKNEKKPGKFNLFFSTGTFFFFPAVIFYLELVFHIYMGLGIKYIPIYLFFSMAGGFLCALLTSYFPERVNKILAMVLTFLLGLIFCIEIVCKTVLAQYYQLASSMSMAVNNHLTDYTGAIIEGILMNIIGIVLMFVPFILLMTLLRKRMKFARKPPALALLSVIGAVVCHLCAVICLHLPYGGELKPA